MVQKTTLPQNVRQGIEAVRKGQYLPALTLLGNFYDHPGSEQQSPDGLSWYGFAIAMVNKDYDHAIECCKVALEKQPDHPAHYYNLARIYLAKGDRKKAVDTTDQGLALRPNDVDLTALRQQLGVRAKPAVPFLDRKHPVNVTLGQARHATRRKKK